MTDLCAWCLAALFSPAAVIGAAERTVYDPLDAIRLAADGAQVFINGTPVELEAVTTVAGSRACARHAVDALAWRR